MDIKKMTEIELKALAYDQIVLLEQCQMNLKAINEELSRRQNAPKEEKK